MGLIDDVFRRAGLDAPSGDGLDLVAGEDAHAVLDAADAMGAQILGIEGFRRFDDGVQPEMDAILDLSALSDAAASVRAARRFLAELQMPDLVYDFTFDEPTNPA